ERAHLGNLELAVGADDAVACNGSKPVFDALPQFGGNVDFSQLRNHFTDPLAVITLGKKRGDASDRIAVRPEWFDRKPKLIEGGEFFFQQHQLTRRELEALRN